MKTSSSERGFFSPRIFISFALSLASVLAAFFGFSNSSSSFALAQPLNPVPSVIVINSYQNDTSRPLRESFAWPPRMTFEREANENPKIPFHHTDKLDAVIQNVQASILGVLDPSIPRPILSFNGISYPGVGCNCAPPDPNGAVGETQYVQIVNEGYQVFDKRTGNSVLGPNSISSIWTGFGGVCENGGSGDPVVLYDHFANRWLISQFAGRPGVFPTDECIAVSTSADATGTYNRYGFHLGTKAFDYPKLSVWPDAFYMSMIVFNSSVTAYLGPQPFAFDRASMLAGHPASLITFDPLGSNVDPLLPADLDGSRLPPAGAPNPFVEFPGKDKYNIYHFHVDFGDPGQSTFTLFASPDAAPLTQICPTTRACVPQKEVRVSSKLDAIGDRLMFRLAYRNFGTHESLVSNYTVKAGGVAGVRWFELRHVTSGAARVFQESTYQPDLTWRWMGSAGMDKEGNLAIGFSASSPSIFPQIRYAGRKATDPLNTLAQGERHLFNGTGSQQRTSNRWGDYSGLSIDPVDDTTFWYTNEYYDATSSFNWRTRIGNFKITGAVAVPSLNSD